ncbi:MAG: hypothetical protein GVY21_10425 [Gammaproteobacteria bacterium]|jgi:hypothetical protein|nr:hypothetical protein [Gammaproteobacteria bacterium]
MIRSLGPWETLVDDVCVAFKAHPAAVTAWRKEERLLALAAWLHRRPGASHRTPEGRLARDRQSS